MPKRYSNTPNYTTITLNSTRRSVRVIRKFYYKIISSRNNLSYNYVVSIISMVSANRELLDKAVDEAMVYIAHKKLDLL